MFNEGEDDHVPLETAWDWEYRTWSLLSEPMVLERWSEWYEINFDEDEGEKKTNFESYYHNSPLWHCERCVNPHTLSHSSWSDSILYVFDDRLHLFLGCRRSSEGILSSFTITEQPGTILLGAQPWKEWILWAVVVGEAHDCFKGQFLHVPT